MNTPAQSEISRLGQVQRDEGEVHGIRYRHGRLILEAFEQPPEVEDVYRAPDQAERFGQASRLGQSLQDDRVHAGEP